MKDKTIYIEITNICPFNCIFCPNQKLQLQRKSLSFNNFKKIFNEIKEIYNHIGLTPIIGEVWYNKDLEKILKFLESQKFKYHFYTNLLTIDQEKVNFLNTLVYGIFYVSVNGTTLEEFNYLNNVSIDNKKYLSLIKIIKNSKLIPIIKTKFKKSPVSKIFAKNIFINNIDNWTGFNKNIYFSKNISKCRVLTEKNIIKMNGDFCLCGCRDPYGKTKIGNIFDNNIKNILSCDEYFKIPNLCKKCSGVDI